MLWVPVKITRSRGVFKQPPLEPKTFVDSVAVHVNAIELVGGFSSRFNIVTSTKGCTSYHSLVSVTVNQHEYSMEGLDTSIMYSVLGSTSKHINPTYDKKKDCHVFSNLSLLLIIYPRFWFPKLMGRPSVMDSPTQTVEV
jgi:hypothetical protein